MNNSSSSLFAETGGNGTRAYRCSECSSVVTYSDRLTAVSGSKTHTFTNPAGMRCDVQTFSSCPGAIAIGQPTGEYTWFPGYEWSLAVCRHCGSHLGWYYEAASEQTGPKDFWGILTYHLIPDS